MAEALTDTDSPFEDYLRQSDAPDQNAGRRPPSVDSATSDPPPPHPGLRSPPHSRPSSAHRPARNKRQTATLERIKYSLATSALLSANLGDAIQLYPPLEALASTSSKGKQRAKIPAEVQGKNQSVGLSWPEDWQTAGQGWTDRTALDNAGAALQGLVGALRRFSRSAPTESNTLGISVLALTQSEPEHLALEALEEFVRAGQELDLRVAAALNAVKELECISHGLGLSDPLPPISRIEARSYTSSLLSPPSPALPPLSLPPLSLASRSPRVPSPLIPSPPRHPTSSAPPPLRAISLRQTLAATFEDVLSAYASTSKELERLLPPNSALLSPLPPPSDTHLISSTVSPRDSSSAPRASLSELRRHASLAAFERAEVDHFNHDNLSTSGSTSSRPSSLFLPNDALEGQGQNQLAFDPFHPTASTFGGIDRRLSPSSPMMISSPRGRPASFSSVSSLSPSLPGGSAEPFHRPPPPQHRLRPSLDIVGAFGVGTATAANSVRGGGGGGGRKKRPVSMGGWSGQSSAFRLRTEGGGGTGGASRSMPGSPALSAQSVPEEDEEETELGGELGSRVGGGDIREAMRPFLLVSLQDAFEDAHDARRAVLWRVLEALEEGDEGVWREVSGVVEKLATGVREFGDRVRGAQELEFEGGAATIRGQRAPGGSADEKEREKEKRRRSGLYGRFDEVDPIHQGGPLRISIPTSSSLPLHSAPASALAARQAALARLTGSASSPLPPSPSPLRRQAPAFSPPAAYADFAPSSSAPSRTQLCAPSSSTQAQLTSLTLPLRSLQAKLRLLSSDLSTLPPSPDRQSSSSPDIGRILATYDSLSLEIDRLGGAWKEGRAALRVGLGVDPPPPLPFSDAEAEEDDHQRLGPEPLSDGEDHDAPPSPITTTDAAADGARNPSHDAFATLDLSSPSASTTSDLDLDMGQRQALLDAALSLSLSPPPSSDADKVFEAVAGPPSRSRTDGEKLSREERIRRMREAREALAAGRVSLGGVGGGGGEGGGRTGGKDGTKAMVGELREVLREINRERGRGMEV
ncbi:hypothetical protein JCM11641_000762 [Rhodosporidiobolus odoratus]